MAEQTSGGSGNTFLAFVLGGVVIAIAVIAYFAFGGDLDKQNKVDVEIKVPKVEGKQN